MGGYDAIFDRLSDLPRQRRGRNREPDVSSDQQCVCCLADDRILSIRRPVRERALNPFRSSLPPTLLGRKCHQPREIRTRFDISTVPSGL